jgi:hypothetical protein
VHYVPAHSTRCGGPGGQPGEEEERPAPVAA